MVSRRKKQDLGKVIRAAIRKQKANGIQIIQLNFGAEINPLNRHKWFCPGGFCDPLGAMVLTYQPRPANSDHKSIMKLFARFGKDQRWVESFWSGTEGDRLTEKEKTELDLRAYQLGKKIRKEFRLWK